jgi:hypothetical protein
MHEAENCYIIIACSGGTILPYHMQDFCTRMLERIIAIAIIFDKQFWK